MYILLCFLVFMTGSCFGSFLHVCLTRKGWLTGRSRCDNCGYSLAWYDLIPIFSYLCLGGRCRSCKEKISSSHIVSEIMMGASFLCSFFCWRKLGCEYGILAFFGLCFMTAAAIEDYVEKKIYTVILYGGILCSSAARAFVFYINGEYVSVLIFAAAVLFLKITFGLISKLTEDKIGNGDFDLLIIIYSLCGAWGSVCSVTYASVIGCAVYLPMLAAKRIGVGAQLAFAPLLLLGTIVRLITAI